MWALRTLRSESYTKENRFVILCSSREAFDRSVPTKHEEEEAKQEEEDAVEVEVEEEEEEVEEKGKEMRGGEGTAGGAGGVGGGHEIRPTRSSG